MHVYTIQSTPQLTTVRSSPQCSLDLVQTEKFNTECKTVSKIMEEYAIFNCQIANNPLHKPNPKTLTALF